MYPALFSVEREYSSNMFQSINNVDVVVELKDIIDKYSRIVILGPPAIGKSTLLKNYVLQLLEQNNLRLFPIFIRVIDYVNYLKSNNQILEEFFDSFSSAHGLRGDFVNNKIRYNIV